MILKKICRYPTLVYMNILFQILGYSYICSRLIRTNVRRVGFHQRHKSLPFWYLAYFRLSLPRDQWFHLLFHNKSQIGIVCLSFPIHYRLGETNLTKCNMIQYNFEENKCQDSSTYLSCPSRWQTCPNLNDNILHSNLKKYICQAIVAD